MSRAGPMAFSLVLACVIVTRASAQTNETSHAESSGSLARSAEGVQPPELRQGEPGAIPVGYHVENRARVGLIFNGTATFVVSYAVVLSLAIPHEREADRWLFLPVFGPVFDVATRGACKEEPRVDCSGAETVVRSLLVLDAVAQGVGATLAICGLAFPKHVLVPDQQPPVSGANRTMTWTIEPHSVGRSGFGMGVTGMF